MKRIFENFLSITGLLLFFYLLINFVHLSWYIANPEGFFGFGYFLDIITALITVVIVLVILTVATMMVFYLIIGFFTKKVNKKSVLSFIGTLIFISFMLLFNHLWANGISLLLNSNLSKKYGYINQTKEYLEEGKVQKAVKYAEKSYEKELNLEPSRFFLLTNVYRLWSYDKKQRLQSLYGATINYGDILYKTLESPENAIEKFKESIVIAENELIKDQSAEFKIYPLLSIAQIYEIQGDYSEAEDYYSTIEKIQGEIGPEETEQVILSRLFKANRAISAGDLESSFEIYRESLELFRESSPEELDSPLYFQLLNLAIMDMLFHKNFTKGADLLVEAKTVLDEIENDLFERQYLSLKGTYCLLASQNKRGDERLISSGFFDLISSNKDVTLENKMLKEAEDCFKESLNISRKNSGKKSHEYIQDLFSLANYYMNINDFEAARPHVEEALKLLESTGFKNIRIYDKFLLFNLLIKSKFQSFDYQIAQQIRRSIFESINTNFITFSEEEKVSFAIYMGKSLRTLNSAYLEQNSNKAYQAVYDNVLGIKNYELDARQNLRAYLNVADDRIRNEYAAVMAGKSRSNLTKKERTDNYKRELELLKIIKEDPRYILLKTKEIGWRQVANSLDTSQAAVEFIEVDISGTNEVVYYALVVEKNAPAPKAIRLFKEEELKSLLNIKGNNKERVNKLYAQKVDSLYNLLIAPIESAIRPKKELLISKTGLLHKLSFSALFKDRPLSFKLFGSTRDILKKVKDSNGSINAVLFGGIDYGPKMNKEDSKKKEGRSTYRINAYPNLEYTEQEVVKIDSIISSIGVARSKIFTKEAATEKTFKNLEDLGYNIIHIATHGYYKKNYFVENGFGLNEDLGFSNNSLARTGLVMAGANIKGRFDYENDGLLTGLEISKMDLSDIDLVVLSACESGLGDDMGSEGVFGLQRSFKNAGVNSLIISLWQVPDKQTSELMIKFYNYYLNGMSKNSALRNAQKDIREKYPEPYYWAGFELLE